MTESGKHNKQVGMTRSHSSHDSTIPELNPRLGRTIVNSESMAQAFQNKGPF